MCPMLISSSDMSRGRGTEPGEAPVLEVGQRGGMIHRRSSVMSVYMGTLRPVEQEEGGRQARELSGARRRERCFKERVLAGVKYCPMVGQRSVQ